jgi:hypothetical protein
MDSVDENSLEAISSGWPVGLSAAGIHLTISGARSLALSVVMLRAPVRAVEYCDTTVARVRQYGTLV